MRTFTFWTRGLTWRGRRGEGVGGTNQAEEGSDFVGGAVERAEGPDHADSAQDGWVALRDVADGAGSKNMAGLFQNSQVLEVVLGDFSLLLDPVRQFQKRSQVGRPEPLQHRQHLPRFLRGPPHPHPSSSYLTRHTPTDGWMDGVMDEYMSIWMNISLGMSFADLFIYFIVF